MGFADPKQFNGYVEGLKKQFGSLTTKQKKRIMSHYNKTYSNAKSLVQHHMGWNRNTTLVWMKTDNPLLGNVSPQLMIATGRGDKLVKWIHQQIDDEKAPDET